MIEIVIPGQPIAKKRPRFVRRGKHTSTYNPSETDEGRAALHIIRAMEGHERITGPCSAIINYIFQRPKSHFGTGRNSEKLKPSAHPYPIKKREGDVDNLEKFVLDCGNGIIYDDDSQVVTVTHGKRYCELGEGPKTIIRIVEV